MEMITESVYGFERIGARKMCVEQMQTGCHNEIQQQEEANQNGNRLGEKGAKPVIERKGPILFERAEPE